MNENSADIQASAQTRPAEKRGLECPKCGCRHFFVIYTRPVAGGRLMRRRECRHCARRITTYETSLG